MVRYGDAIFIFGRQVLVAACMLLARRDVNYGETVVVVAEV